MKALRVLSLLVPGVLAAQGVRITGTTSIQLIELRPLVIDSALASTISGTGEWRATPDGVPALCAISSAYCRFERSGNRVSAAPVLQDITVAGWGWTEGLSFHANLRGRTQLGAQALDYPRSREHFDVVDAYAQLDRGDWRSRLGRQWIIGGLGAYTYDGADVFYQRNAYSVEGWGGRALLGGLDEPYTSSMLAAVDNLPPTQDGYIFGGRARWRPDALGAATFTYQRILVADRSGLYSERAALDASSRRFGASVDLGLNYDLASGNWNDARLRVGTGGLRNIGGSLEVRHSQPFFELWTIWGAFAPVGYDETRATLDWRPHGVPLTFAFHGAYRRYADTEAGFELRTNGWRAGADALWSGPADVSAFGTYDIDIGSGAASTDARAGVRWVRESGAALSLEGSVTQNIYEFRVGTGRIYGVYASGAVPIAPELRLALDGGLYQHALTNGAAGPDWTQRRVSMRLEWTVGRDPGKSP